MTQKNNRNYFDLDKDQKSVRRQSWLRITKRFILKGPEKWRDRKPGRIWDYIVDFFQLTMHYDLFTQSASVVYYLLLAFFPLLILVMYFTAIISRNIEITPETIEAAQTLLPDPVLDITSSLARGISAPLSPLSLAISSITALWASSRGIGQIFRSIASIFPKKEKGFSLPARFAGIIITVIIFILFALSYLILSFGRALFNFIDDLLPFIDFNFFAFDLITYGIGLLLIFIIMFVLYFISSRNSAEKLPIIPGSLIASFAWIALSYLYSFYIANRANISNLYGGLANIIILMLWLNFSVQIIHYGALINYQIAWYKVQKKENYQILNETIRSIDENENPFDYLQSENYKKAPDNSNEVDNNINRSRKKT
ncbi:MAG: YihY/virulence factor BrkB family protein [Clostridiaceae bacterium]|nr:YihY/virulence factor BrkB family protein [Clostridiaceae bacterium]